MITVFVNGKQNEYDEQTSLLKISQEWQKNYESPIVAALVNNELCDLQKTITDRTNIEFITQSSSLGEKVYASSLVMLLYTAVKEVFTEAEFVVRNSFSGNVYCQIKKIDLKPDYVKIIKDKMQELIEQKEQFFYHKIDRKMAEKLLANIGDYDRLGIITQLDDEHKTVSAYSCLSHFSYFFSPLVPDASYLKVFDLLEYNGDLLLRCPNTKADFVQMSQFVDQPKLFAILKESEEWAKIIGCDTITNLNKIIKKGKLKNIIQIAEALHEKKIASIADIITQKGDKTKLILIAGPSSSGKTTFTQRLKIQLQVNGINPVPISIDDYFLERTNCPRKANGDYDFESINALDLELFNEHLQKLLEGKTVQMPTFNFVTGSREYRGKKITLNANQPLLIEGIHGLNDLLTKSVPPSAKVKIYISPLTKLRLDEHNLVSRSNVRLLRRLVRDNRFRAHNAQATIKQWQYVLQGEEEYILPYQENTDIMFNTSLLYELAALKKYAQPLLQEITSEQKEYTMARQLLDLLELVQSIEDEEIPSNSILKEFIGDKLFFE